MLLKKLIIIFFSSCIFFTGCSVKKENSRPDAGTKKENTKKTTIGFSIDTLAIERWQRDLDVFMATCRELGADVIVQNAGNSVEEQNRQLMYLLERDVQAVIVVPKEADSIVESVEKIRKQNIPVISYDRLTLEADISLYITIDSQRVGEIMAEKMKTITASKNYAYILGPKEDFNMTMILKGLKKTLKDPEYFSGEVFYTNGWNYDLSKQRITELIAKSEIPDAIICGNDAVADSVIEVLNLYYPGLHIPICGQDADIAACQNIVRGRQDFTVYKPINELAQKAAEISVSLARGKKTEDLGYSRVINNGYAEIPAIMIEPCLVDAENIDTVIIQSGFHTQGEVYN